MSLSHTASMDGVGGFGNVGGSVYLTVMTCVAVALLPQPSLAVQVRVRVKGLAQVGIWVESTVVRVTFNLIKGSLLQAASVAVTLGGSSMLPKQSTVMSAGTFEKMGLAISLILNVCGQLKTTFPVVSPEATMG
jgi:hypothetical protein